MSPTALNSIKPKILSEFLSGQDGTAAGPGGEDSGMSLSDIVRRFSFQKVPIPLLQNELRRQIRTALETSLEKLQAAK